MSAEKILLGHAWAANAAYLRFTNYELRFGCQRDGGAGRWSECEAEFLKQGELLAGNRQGALGAYLRFTNYDLRFEKFRTVGAN